MYIHTYIHKYQLNTGVDIIYLPQPPKFAGLEMKLETIIALKAKINFG